MQMEMEVEHDMEGKDDMEMKTPLFEQHVAHKGNIVNFAGYMLPVMYEGIIEEHMAVRREAGLFDVSHMGEITICGDDALDNLNYIFSNDFTNMADGMVRYTLICNEAGGIVDDMTVYRFSLDRYMIVPNAANRKKVLDFIDKHMRGNAKLKDESDNYALISIQGPKSHDILARLTSDTNIPKKYYTFVDKADVAGVACIISQTGYTGEYGYEIYCQSNDANRLWRDLLEAGEESGLIPCGLGARDTLRLEASLPLYGHEMNDEISPFETGLAFVVKMSKQDFVGKEALESRGAPKLARVGLKVVGKGIVREDCPVFLSEKKIGTTTSGTHLPYLNGAYAMALVNISESGIGTVVEAEVRGRRIAAEIVALPFYRRKGI